MTITSTVIRLPPKCRFVVTDCSFSPDTIRALDNMTVSTYLISMIENIDTPIPRGRGKTIGRRCFVGAGITFAAGCFVCGRMSVAGNDEWFPDQAKEALHYKKLGAATVQCLVCPRECVIGDGKRGMCGTRENRKGVLYSLVYGRVASYAPDPIEKKPFFHVVPGSIAFSIATAGCNMTCKFCQNYTLSQAKPEELKTIGITPHRLAAEAKRSGSQFIAYTYNEPTVFTEFAHDCSVTGKVEGLGSVVISNGYINAEPLDRLCAVINAFKVDLKAFNEPFYHDVTGGTLASVLGTIKRLKKNGVWTELVHLTIPSLNDGDEDFKKMGAWLMNEIGPDIPVHFTRFHPQYLLKNLPATPVSTLERARAILKDAGIRYVYIGNVPGHEGESTWCHSCGKKIIERTGYRIASLSVKDGKCGFCGTRIPGVWSVY